jgi:hypothetical protein
MKVCVKDCEKQTPKLRGIKFMRVIYVYSTGGHFATTPRAFGVRSLKANAKVWLRMTSLEGKE